MMKRIVFVSCSKRKALERTEARRLYTSPLFSASVSYAESLGSDWYILSAKYGLLAPNDEISPYDESLKNLSRSDRLLWANKVAANILALSKEPCEAVILAGSSYAEPISTLLQEKGWRVSLPLRGLSQGHRLKWLRDGLRLGNHALDLEMFYEIVEKLLLVQGNGRGYGFGDSFQRSEIPSRGVYFFFEEGQYRRGRSTLRVTRVGTHAVSQGSISTLWSRLRTHRGTLNGNGSHRSSVFRRHIGQSLLNQNTLRDLYPTWNTGQQADKQTREQEAPMEALVSNELKRFRFIVLSVSDEPSAFSDRAYIERNSVGLLSTVGHIIDPPVNWLGAFSPTDALRESGLWNVDYVGGPYSSAFLGVFSKLAASMLNEMEPSNISLAPSNWKTELRVNNQLMLNME